MAKPFRIIVNDNDIDKLIRTFKAIPTQSVNSATKRAAGKAGVTEMQELISGGVSPIKGRGRFPGYKKSYKDRIRRGGGDFSSKSIRPVNLRLSGKFLKSLNFKELRNGISIGFYGQEASRSAKKESGHRFGTNRQRKRPIIPRGSENLAASVSDKISQVLEKAIVQKIKSLFR